jgi:hypothetical protein
LRSRAASSPRSTLRPSPERGRLNPSNRHDSARRYRRRNARRSGRLLDALRHEPFSPPPTTTVNMSCFEWFVNVIRMHRMKEAA